MADKDEELESAKEKENQDGEDAEDAEGAEGEEASGKGGKKIIILVVVALLVLIGVGAGLYFSGILDSVLGKEECVEVTDDHGEVTQECPEEEAQAEDDAHASKGGGGHGEGSSAFLALPTMIVNLRTEDETPRYLRLTVQLEMNDPADATAVEAVIPRVVDQFQTYLRELRVKDLRGSAGIYRLQMELLWRVNQAAAPIEVKDVLFQEILIQ